MGEERLVEPQDASELGSGGLQDRVGRCVFELDGDAACRAPREVLRVGRRRPFELGVEAAMKAFDARTGRAPELQAPERQLVPVSRQLVHAAPFAPQLWFDWLPGLEMQVSPSQQPLHVEGPHEVEPPPPPVIAPPPPVAPPPPPVIGFGTRGEHATRNDTASARPARSLMGEELFTEAARCCERPAWPQLSGLSPRGVVSNPP